MNVTVAPELEQFLETAVSSGRYQSASEVANAALRLLQQQEPMKTDAIEPLHARVDGALKALTRGDGEDGEAYVENPAGELEASQEDERVVPR